MTEKPHRTQLNEIFRAEYRRMVRYVSSLIDDAAERDSEDIVQDVMTSFLAQADISQPINNLASYLYQGLRNRVVDMMRRRRNQVSLDAQLPGTEEQSTLKDLIADITQDSSALIEKKQLQSKIMEAIESLSDDQRAIVVATEIHERSFSDCAKDWGVPIGTLLARKSRAFENIREKISQTGDTNTTSDNNKLKGASYV